MPFQIHSSSLTDKGRKRPNNEDSVDVFEPTNPADLTTSGCLYIVADGVGGEADGERASKYAVQKILYYYYNQPQGEPGERLKGIIRRVGNEIYDYTQDTGYGRRMATTVVVAVVHGNFLTIANVGDSRAYLIRDGVAEQISEDHNLVGEMVRNGVLTEAESLTAKVKNRLTRSLGGEEDPHVFIRANIPLKPGDKILLCSDGLHRYTLSKDIAQLTAEGTPEKIAERLIDYANHKGGQDNISVVLVQIGQYSNNLEVTVRAPRQAEKLNEINWDEIKTDPGIQTRRRKSFFDRLKPWQIVGSLIGLLAIVALASYGVYSLLSQPGGGKGVSQEAMVEQYVQDTKAAILAKTQSATTDTVSLLQANLRTDTPAPTVTSTSTPTFTSSPEPTRPTEITTPTETATPTPTSNPSSEASLGVGACYLKPPNSAGMIRLLTPFNIVYAATNQYQQCTAFDNNGNPALCKTLIDIDEDVDSAPKLTIDMWVLIPGDVAKQACQSAADQMGTQFKWLPKQR